jgi:ubiquinone biosynthesis protein
VSDYVSLIRELPGEVNEILYKLKEGKLTHEIDLVNKTEFQASITKVSYRIALALLLGFLLTTATITIVWGEGNNALAKFVLTLTLMMSAIVGFKWFFRSRTSAK